MLNAPHHTWRSTPSPASTHTRCTLAASACRSVRNTLATTTPSTGVPTISVASTDNPSDVMATANSSSLQRRRSANSSSHERTMRIRTVSRSASHWHTYREGRKPHDALWPCDRCRSQTRNPYTPRGRCPRLAARSGAPCRSPRARPICR